MAETSKITSFRGRYYWLSNFIAVDVSYNGVTFPSVEHAYQAMKSVEAADWPAFADAHLPPGGAKRMGKRLTLRSDWNEVRVVIMRELLRQKFSQKPFRALLLATGQAEIVEGNNWGDTFWGVDDLRGGENMLGKLIMEVRAEVRRATRMFGSVDRQPEDGEEESRD